MADGIVSAGWWRARRARVLGAVVTAAVTALAAACSHGATSATSDQSFPELAGPAGVASAPQAGHPNIVFVLTDDLDTSLLRYMPHVQQLAARGASFTDYNDADTLCCPSRSSIFTGKFPHDTGVFTNTNPDGGYDVFKARDEQDTFATHLQQAGYHTAMMGKYLNGYQPGSPTGEGAPGKKQGGIADTSPSGAATGYVPPGWNEWDVAGNGYPEFNYDLNENGHVVRHGSDASDYLVDVLSGKGADFIRAQAAAHQPFLLEVATFAPHSPYTPAPRNANDFPGLIAPRDPSFNTPDAPTAPAWLRDRTPLNPRQVHRLDVGYRKRAQAVEAVDALVANLETTLDQTGQTANTDIVFSSDNGYHMGQHELTAGKQTTFATDLTVPLIATGPGIPARPVGQMVQNIDLAPTFVDLAHAAPLAAADGHTLTPLLAGQDPPDWRQVALIEHHGPNTDPSDPDDYEGPDAEPAATDRGRADPPSYIAVHVGTETYTEYATGEREYHDTRTDPYQQDNTVAQLPPAQVAALHQLAVGLSQCHGAASCWQAGHTP